MESPNGFAKGPTCHQRDRADVTEFVTLVRLSSLGQHVGVLALAGYKRRKSALTAVPIARTSFSKILHKQRTVLVADLFLPPDPRPQVYGTGYVYKGTGGGLWSGIWRQAPLGRLHKLRPGHRTCSFISHLSPPGSIQTPCHFRRTAVFKDTSLHCPTIYPLTPGSRECTCWQSALPRSTTFQHNSDQQRSNPRSLTCKSRTRYH